MATHLAKHLQGGVREESPRETAGEPAPGLRARPSLQKKGQRAGGTEHRMCRPHPFPFRSALRYQPADFATQIKLFFPISYLLGNATLKVQGKSASFLAEQ